MVYSVTENGKSAKLFLERHEGRTRALHSFGPLEERMHDGDRKVIDRIMTTHIAEYHERGAWKARDIIDGDEFEYQTRWLKRSCLKMLLDAYAQMEFKETAWCSTCHGLCFLNPRANPRCRSAWWTEGGGNTCTPWTLYGKSLGWLDPESTSALTWAFSAKYYGVDTLLQECTPLFDTMIFQEILTVPNVDSPRSIHGVVQHRRRLCGANP